ncbi:DC1 [Dillenia turbinata]|uniref:DC1 n=1 Tax=Dillenia turbinata TaxID=194707 RepID=A0AAN8ZFM6_9MAGN
MLPAKQRPPSALPYQTPSSESTSMSMSMSMSSKPLRKSRTFMLKKSTSTTMELPVPTFTNYPSSNYVLKKSPSLEFPTSPEPIIQGEEILHSIHPRHPLVQVCMPEPFTCMGCKEYGAGNRFVCLQCNFELHEFCALAPSALKSHPFHAHHHLKFCSKPVKGGMLGTKCNICNKSIKGFSFQCSACSFQMHPCCAMLSTKMNFPIHPHTLNLLPSKSLSSADPSLACGECKKKRSGKIYHCPICDYHLHAVCAKNMVNGLEANGIKGLEKPSMLGTAARFASQVVIEFIGGLIEGIGEGVGEVLISNMSKGRHTST